VTRVANSAPLILFFDHDENAIADQVRLLCSDPKSVFQLESFSVGIGEFSILYDGVSLTLRIMTPPAETVAYRRIFTGYESSSAKCVLELNFNAHVAGGERVPPVVLALFSAGAVIAQSLYAKAVLWSPANLLSETEYFAEAVKGYANGGAFPVLSTIDFEFDRHRRTFLTSGLTWFSGQELKLDGTDMPLDQMELMKRTVRLAHDIAANGPVLKQQAIADLQPHAKIVLSPDLSATLVFAKITSTADQSSMAIH
jgi:hypothetical protein